MCFSTLNSTEKSECENRFKGCSSIAYNFTKKCQALLKTLPGYNFLYTTGKCFFFFFFFPLLKIIHLCQNPKKNISDAYWIGLNRNARMWVEVYTSPRCIFMEQCFQTRISKYFPWQKKHSAVTDLTEDARIGNQAVSFYSPALFISKTRGKPVFYNVRLRAVQFVWTHTVVAWR